MYTIAETEVFSRYISDYWTEDERAAFAVWIAEHYDTGDIIPGSGGCRKVRWSRKGKGKSGGLRVIYYNMLEDDTIWLLLIYAKNEHENIPAHLLKAIKEKITCP
ncbi:MAG: type II toxin-antitoxin system RelE/ParE family toxin [Proteobacteria bacterium]|nr:type II toxin-antitoxin system RelE/ParE family toxin [Pseudomonadota bacterium]